MRIVGMDIHRVFAEVALLAEGTLRGLGRVEMQRDKLEAFARAKLTRDDHVVLEATGNASALAELLRPFVGRVVIANPKQVRLIAHAKIKTGGINAAVLAKLYARFPAGGLGGRRGYPGPAPPGDAAAAAGAAADAAEEHDPIHPACAPDPALSARRHHRPQRSALAAPPGSAERRAPGGRAPLGRARPPGAGPEHGRAGHRPAGHGGSDRRAPDDPARSGHGGRVGARGGHRGHRAFPRSTAPGGLPRPEPERAPVGRRPGLPRADCETRPWPCPGHAGRGRLGSGAIARPAAGFFLRIAARRGQHVAAVATARKLAAIAWHMLRRGEDYTWVRPALHARKLRELELRSGSPSRRGHKGAAAAYNLPEARRLERRRVEQAQAAYERLVGGWTPRGPGPRGRTGRASAAPS